MLRKQTDPPPHSRTQQCPDISQLRGASATNELPREHGQSRRKPFEEEYKLVLAGT